MQACQSTVLGTNVLIIDERNSSTPYPHDRAAIARRLADPHFGVGCALVAFLGLDDGVPLNRQIGSGLPEFTQQISQGLLDQTLADVVFVRTFLPSGYELIVSATALCAAADYLCQYEERREGWLLSGNTTTPPHLHYVYRDLDYPMYSVAIGQAEQLPARFITPLYGTLTTPLSGQPAIEQVSPVLPLPTGSQPCVLYAIYTGEPHLVSLIRPAGSAADPARDQQEIFADIFEHPGEAVLFEHIVAYLNGRLDLSSPLHFAGVTLPPPAGIFRPDEGVNVVFARLHDDNTMEARFYCRGTSRERRLSGTGAVAATLVSYHLGLLSHPRAEIRGWLNTIEGRHEAAVVRRSGDMWWFEAPVQRIWSGSIT